LKTKQRTDKLILKSNKGGDLKMKVRDFFLPKIARSDPHVRKKAVMAESNVDVLKRVVQNDSDKDVRQAARKRLQRLSP
jgi:uncharacterized transporter YbjL